MKLTSAFITKKGGSIKYRNYLQNKAFTKLPKKRSCLPSKGDWQLSLRFSFCLFSIPWYLPIFLFLLFSQFFFFIFFFLLKKKLVGRYKNLEKEAHKVWKDMDDHIFCFRSSLMAIYSSRRLLCYWQLSNANRSLGKEIFSSIYLLEGVIYNIWIRCVWLLPLILNICYVVIAEYIAKKINYKKIVFIIHWYLVWIYYIINLLMFSKD